MPVNLKEIATKAGVSIQTASDILNCGRHDRYDPKTQARVREIALQHHYRPQRSGRVLRSQTTGIVGFVAANFSPKDGRLEHYDVYPFLVGVSHYLTACDYHVGLVELAEIEQGSSQKLPPSLQERFFEGLIVHWGLEERFRKIFRLWGISAVWWDTGSFAPTNCLDRDETEVGQAVTKRLIELGHRRIGLMVGQRSWQQYQRTGQPPHYSYAQRYESYRAQLRRHKMTEIPLIGYDVAALAAQMKEHQLTAVITQSAASIPIVQLAAQSLSWRVPEDLSVAACDVEARVRPTDMQVGGMAYDRYAVGQQAAEMLLRILRASSKSAPSVKFTGEFSMGDTIAAHR